MSRRHKNSTIEDHDRGLAHDLAVLTERMLERRRFLRWTACASLVPILGCGDDPSMDGGGYDGLGGSGAYGGLGGAGGAGGYDGLGGAGGDAGIDSCTTIPEETAGPYPGDGSNGPNVLVETGVVRSDIRSSFGGATGVAEGIPMTVTLTLVSSDGTCAPLSDHAIYLWHCDQLGRYSLYSSGATDQNYLRGVQVTDSRGQVTFTTIFPGCYSGRWPHMHFEVFASLETATGAGAGLKTSQLALPEAVSDEVYATTGYTGSANNLQQISLATDNVFRDGVTSQLASVTGDVDSGYVATLTVGVAT